MKKILVGAALAAVTVGLAPVAHANPDTYYLTCINMNGFTITDTSEALLWAKIVQDEEIANVPRSSIVFLLESDGSNYAKANVIIDCAWKAYNN